MDRDIQYYIDVVSQMVVILAVTGTIGAALNPIISYIKTFLGFNKIGNKTVKIGIQIITSIAGGIATVVSLNLFIISDLLTLLITSVLVFIASYIVYQNYWKESEGIKRIEGTY